MVGSYVPWWGWLVVGVAVGPRDVGETVGESETGENEGDFEGDTDGNNVLGLRVGFREGVTDGAKDGDDVGGLKYHSHASRHLMTWCIIVSISPMNNLHDASNKARNDSNHYLSLQRPQQPPPLHAFFTH